MLTNSTQSPAGQKKSKLQKKNQSRDDITFEKMMNEHRGPTISLMVTPLLFGYQNPTCISYFPEYSVV